MFIVTIALGLHPPLLVITSTFRLSSTYFSANAIQRPALNQKRSHVSGLPQEAGSSRAGTAEGDGSSAGRRCPQRASARPVPVPRCVRGRQEARTPPAEDSKQKAAGSVCSSTRGTRARGRRPERRNRSTDGLRTSARDLLSREPRHAPTAPAARGLQPHAPGRRATATRPQRRDLRNAAPPHGGSRPRGAGPAAFAQSPGPRGAGRRCAVLRAHHAAGGGVGDLASGTPPTPWLPPTPLPATFAPTPATGRALLSSQRDGRGGEGSIVWGGSSRLVLPPAAGSAAVLRARPAGGCWLSAGCSVVRHPSRPRGGFSVFCRLCLRLLNGGGECTQGNEINVKPPLSVRCFNSLEPLKLSAASGGENGGTGRTSNISSTATDLESHS